MNLQIIYQKNIQAEDNKFQLYQIDIVFERVYDSKEGCRTPVNQKICPEFYTGPYGNLYKKKVDSFQFKNESGKYSLLNLLLFRVTKFLELCLSTDTDDSALRDIKYGLQIHPRRLVYASLPDVLPYWHLLL